MLPSLFSGARGVLKINNKAFAFVTQVSVNVTHNVRATHTFGSPNARSVEPLSYSCSVSIGAVVPVNDSNGTAINSSAVSMGAESLIALFTRSEDISIDLEDQNTNTTVAAIRNARFTGRSLSSSAGNLASASYNFVAIYDSVGGNAPTRLGFDS
jgi:hypothetical protein